MKINIESKVVDVFDLNEISCAEWDDVRLRLEVFFDINKKHYGVKVYRFEYYSLNPTFMANPDLSCKHDALICVLDDHFLGNEFYADSLNESVEMCLKEINAVFSCRKK